MAAPDLVTLKCCHCQEPPWCLHRASGTGGLCRGPGASVGLPEELPSRTSTWKKWLFPFPKEVIPAGSLVLPPQGCTESPAHTPSAPGKSEGLLSPSCSQTLQLNLLAAQKPHLSGKPSTHRYGEVVTGSSCIPHESSRRGTSSHCPRKRGNRPVWEEVNKEGPMQGNCLDGN